MTDMESGTTGQRLSNAPSTDQAPCELPWAPGGWQSMVPCAPIALVSLAQ